MSYIHAGGKVGVLLELNCETDFVARTEAFQSLAKDICLHIAAANPQYLDRASVPATMVDKEKEIYSEQLKTQGKPANVVEGILKGKLDKFYEDMCLLEQSYVKDDTKKIEQVVTEASAETGEKITIRRFVRYELGEGIKKEEKNFAEEVAAQLKK
jgi:elongation factor Ts